MKWIIWLLAYVMTGVIINILITPYIITFPELVKILIYILVFLIVLNVYLRLIDLIYKIGWFHKLSESNHGNHKKRKKTTYEKESYVEEASLKEKKEKLQKIRLHPKTGFSLNKKPFRGGIILLAKKYWKLMTDIFVVNGQEHSLLIGSPGSGKTYCFIYPLICNTALSNESMIVNDPKGELHLGTRNFLEEVGYEIQMLNFINPYKSLCWNPYQLFIDAYEAELKRIEQEKQQAEEHHMLYGTSIQLKNIKPNFSKALEYLRDTTQALLANEKDEAIWKEGALKLIEGVALLLMEKGFKNKVNFSNIIHIVNTEQNGKKSYLQSMMQDASHEVINRLNMYVSAPDKTKQSLMASFNAYLAKYEISEDIQKMTSSTNIDIRKLVKEKKQVIFVHVHDNKSTYHALASLFYKQCYDIFIEESKQSKHYYETGVDKVDIPVNFVLDEFGIMPAISDIEAVFAASRGRDVRYILVVQSFEQLEQKYGHQTASIIRAAISHLVYLKSGDEKTHEKLSVFFGKTLVWNSKAGVYEEKQMYTATRLSKYKQGYAFIRTQGKNPYYTKFLGYKDYPFYRKPYSELDLQAHELPDLTLFNIKEYVLSKI